MIEDFSVGDTIKWNLRVRPPLATDTIEFRRKQEKKFDELALSWHFGTVLKVDFSEDPYVEVEYTHSLPPISYEGNVLRLHKLSNLTVV